mmetsp:Transcript_4741/g.13262  ORF Transcript_4741/g.13262 Transcript_4741/m.13262 type:complete len:94 (-) Transcript_4741:760-1041(-)
MKSFRQVLMNQQHPIKRQVALCPHSLDFYRPTLPSFERGTSHVDFRFLLDRLGDSSPPPRRRRDGKLHETLDLGTCFLVMLEVHWIKHSFASS